MFLSYTIFEDRARTQVRSVANLEGEPARNAFATFKRDLGREPREGDVLFGCRIDRIGSEDFSEVEAA